MRNLINIALLLFCPANLCLAQSNVAAVSPNIVFILADDMNRDTWGVYGGVDCKTPNIDRLAKDGVRFDRAYCAVAMCAPFRQELYSGRTPWRTGTLPNHSKSKPRTKSIAHYLQPLGYRVALVGKSHVGPGKCYPLENLDAGGKGKTSDRNPFLVQAAQRFLNDCAQEDQPFCLFGFRRGGTDFHRGHHADSGRGRRGKVERRRLRRQEFP